MLQLKRKENIIQMTTSIFTTMPKTVAMWPYATIKSRLGLGWSMWPVVPLASLVFSYAPSLLVIIRSFLTRQIKFFASESEVPLFFALAGGDPCQYRHK